MNDNRSGRRGDWKKSAAQTDSKSDRSIKIVFTGLLLLGILAFLVYWNWPTPDPKSKLFIIAAGPNTDMPEIPFQNNDISALAASFGDDPDTSFFNDPKSFQASVEKIIETAANDLDPIDTLMLYVSGHGYRVNSGGVPKAAILTTDFKPGQPDPTLDQSGAVSIAKLIAETAKIDVSTKVVFLDIGHFYQNPHDGVFVNDYVFALHNELKNWPESSGENEESENIWLVTSSSLLEVPLFSQSRKRTLFNEAIESTIAADFERETLQNGLSIGDLYSKIYSYTKTHGGPSAQTPLLFRVGTGLVETPESTPELKNTVAFFPSPTANNRDEDESAEENKKNEGDTDAASRNVFPNVQPISFQEPINQQTTQPPTDKQIGDQKKLPNDQVEEWVTKSLNKRVPFSTTTNTELNKKETTIREYFSAYYSARFRIHQYFQLFEVISFFQIETSDPLHDTINDLSDVLEQSSNVFEPAQYEINDQVIAKFKLQIEAVTSAENRTRKAINKAFQKLDSESSYETQSIRSLVSNCDLTQKPPSKHLQELAPLVFAGQQDEKNTSEIERVELVWSTVDPWRLETKSWQRLSNRLTLSHKLLGQYNSKAKQQNAIQLNVRIPQSGTGLRFEILDQLRETGIALRQQFANRFPIDGSNRFFADHARTMADSYGVFFPEFDANDHQISKLDLQRPRKQEIVAIEALPESMIVEKNGSKLRLRLRAQGEGLNQLKLQFSFVDENVPFEIANGLSQTIKLDGGITFNHQIDLTSLSDSANQRWKDKYEVTISAIGLEKKAIRKMFLVLPQPDRVDIAISRLAKNKTTTLFKSKRSAIDSDRARIEVYPNRNDTFQLSLVNQFHQPKTVRVSLYECKIEAGKILPERINNFIKQETLDGIRSGQIKEFLAAKVELDAKMTVEKPVSLLSPDDPKLADKAAAKKDGAAGGSNNNEVKPSELGPQNANLNNGFLCRVSDLNDATVNWDYWIEVFPMDPNYVTVVPEFRNGRVSLELGRKQSGVMPDNIKLNWRLVNSKNEKLLIENDFFELGKGQQNITLIESASAELLQDARLTVDVDGWPRRFIFDFESSRFRRKNDLREVRIVSVAPQNTKQETGKPAAKKIVELPKLDNVKQFGFRVADNEQRPTILNAHLEVDTSVIEHFGLDSKSEILFAPGSTPNSFWRLNYPRAISTTAKGDPQGGISIHSAVTDFTSLPVYVGGYKIKLKPELRLDLGGDAVSRFPQPEQQIVFDDQKPKITTLEFVKESVRMGDQPKLTIQVKDSGVGIDQQSGITFYSSKERILSLDELKPIRPTSSRKVGNYIEYGFQPTKEVGELHFAAKVQDRVGNSVNSFDEASKRNFSITVLPKKELAGGTKDSPEPKTASVYELTVNVVVGSQKLNQSTHKKPKITITPADAVGVRVGDRYVFSGLKKGVKYVIVGEVTVTVGKATGNATSDVPIIAKGKTHSVQLKLEL